MQMSASLADFTARLESGPAGLEDAKAAIETGMTSKTDTLDLSQMCLVDEDIVALLPLLHKLGPHVTSLNLFLNELTNLPAGLGAALPKLKSLLVGANPLKTISDDAFEGMPNLEIVDVGFSEELRGLPASIGLCVSLKILYAGNGRLASLPTELFNCSNLEELHAYGNALANVPVSIGQLTKLQLLSVGRNQIRALPSELAQCSALRALYVYENELNAFPPGLEKLPKLRVVNAENNLSLPPVPREIRLECSPQQVAAFYAKT